mmetsp:Transcript_140344/g.391283  ORF Transcript_140344/g.391283 Transcript_140344/m.391283 type:complete len:207 (-) Transcript_140344:343-963(-)
MALPFANVAQRSLLELGRVEGLEELLQRALAVAARVVIPVALHVAICVPLCLVLLAGPLYLFHFLNQLLLLLAVLWRRQLLHRCLLCNNCLAWHRGERLAVIQPTRRVDTGDRRWVGARVACFVAVASATRLIAASIVGRKPTSHGLGLIGIQAHVGETANTTCWIGAAARGLEARVGITTNVNGLHFPSDRRLHADDSSQIAHSR